MRLMFERDLTPHPQYCAFYEWLWQQQGQLSRADHAPYPEARPAPASGACVDGVAADAVVHVGMHGTVEWLPGSPLGGTATSWPDKLLGGTSALELWKLEAFLSPFLSPLPASDASTMFAMSSVLSDDDSCLTMNVAPFGVSHADPEQKAAAMKRKKDKERCLANQARSPPRSPHDLAVISP